MLVRREAALTDRRARGIAGRISGYRRVPFGVSRGKKAEELSFARPARFRLMQP